MGNKPNRITIYSTFIIAAALTLSLILFAETQGYLACHAFNLCEDYPKKMQELEDKIRNNLNNYNNDKENLAKMFNDLDKTYKADIDKQQKYKLQLAELLKQYDDAQGKEKNEYKKFIKSQEYIKKIISRIRDYNSTL